MLGILSRFSRFIRSWGAGVGGNKAVNICQGYPGRVLVDLSDQVHSHGNKLWHRFTLTHPYTHTNSECSNLWDTDMA